MFFYVYYLKIINSLKMKCKNISQFKQIYSFKTYVIKKLYHKYEDYKINNNDFP